MGIAKSENTVLGTHCGGRIRSLLARTAGAIGSAIERLGTFFALAVTSAFALASTVATWGPTVSMDQADESVVRLPLSDSGVPRRTFDGRVGYGLGDGIPTVSWLEIGLGDKAIIGEDMPSWWFPIALDNFAASDGDPNETAERAMSGLSAELERLTGDPAYALWFFSTKIGGEWLTPDFESRFFAGQCNYSVSYPWLMLLGFLSRNSLFSM